MLVESRCSGLIHKINDVYSIAISYSWIVADSDRQCLFKKRL